MERTVAKCLLEIKSIFFGFEEEYINATGLRMPVYCDNRLILSYPRVRKALTKWLSNLVKEKYPDVEMIVGTATAGIAFSSLLSEYLNLPMAYVLERKKDHGFKNRVEGLIKDGVKVVVVDDVICTGETILDASRCLREKGCEILGSVCIVSYELESTIAKLNEEKIQYCALTNYDTVNLVGMQAGKISYSQFKKALKFKENPQSNEWLEV
jgi:orotate phosphoribosyltransferase